MCFLTPNKRDFSSHQPVLHQLGPTIPFHSDVNYQKLAQTPQTVSTSGTSHKWGAPGTHTSAQLTINSGFPRSAPWTQYLVKLTELKKVFYLLLLVYLKGYNSGTPNGSHTYGRVGEGEAECPCLLQVCQRPSTSVCWTAQKLSEPHCLGFSWRLHSLGMVD